MAKTDQDAGLTPPTENVTDPAVEAASEGRPSATEYKSSGNTVVKTHIGHAVVPLDESLPVVTEDGVKMSKENAEKVVETYPAYAYIDNNEED